MGSAASKRTAEVEVEEPKEPEIDPRKQILLQRKVTVDILGKLARSLPVASNPLGKTLNLDTNTSKELEWNENLNYLQEWKRSRNDDATIGNLIDLLKSAQHTSDEYECLFNISREPRNASTETERIETERIETERDVTPRSAYRLISPPSTRNYQPTIESECYPTPSAFARSKSPQVTTLPPDFQPPRHASSEELDFLPSTSRLLYDIINDHSDTPRSHQKTPRLAGDDVTLHASYFPDSKFNRPPSHGWMDFRNLREVDQSWFVVDDASLTNGKVGNYLPGITGMKEDLVVSDVNNKCLHFFNKSGNLTQTRSTGSLIPGSVCGLSSEVLAISFGRVVGLWSHEGRKKKEFGNGFFGWCRGICVDRNKRIIISDVEKKRVSIHSETGQLITNLQLGSGEKFGSPYHLAVDHKNNILVCDATNNSVYMFDKNGLFARTLIRSNSENKLRLPMGMETDCCGNLLIANHGQSRLSLYNSDGWFLHDLLPPHHVIHRPVTLSMIGQNKLIVSSICSQPLQMFEFS